MSTWLLIACQRARLPLLHATLESLQHPRERVVIVTTHPDPIQESEVSDLAGTLLTSHAEGQRISSWWNLGIDHIRDTNTDAEYEIAAVSSDCAGDPDSIPRLWAFLRVDGLIMAGPDWHTTEPRIFTATDKRTLLDRVPGSCWMLRGESGLRLDEDFRWWYSDDDLEMQARQLGPVGVVPGTGFWPGPDSDLSDVTSAWAVEDRQKYVDKWGVQPW